MDEDWEEGVHEGGREDEDVSLVGSGNAGGALKATCLFLSPPLSPSLGAGNERKPTR
jgi:hypothetical protein